MAIPVNTKTSVGLVGVREDLSDHIALVANEETPFFSMLKTEKMTGARKEWQVDGLVAVNPDNANFSGDIKAFQARPQTTRVGNYPQFFRKDFNVTDKAIVLNTAGRSDQLAYETMKAVKEIKRDIESVLTGNQGEQNEISDAQPGLLRGFESWIATNVNRGTGGSNAPNPTSGAVDGTDRNFTQASVAAGDLAGEAALNNILRSRYHRTGEASKQLTMLLSPQHHDVAASFKGRDQSRIQVDLKEVQGAVDLVITNYGRVMLKPSVFHAYRPGPSSTQTFGNSILLCDPEYLCVSYLRPMFREKLARVTDAVPFMIGAELTLIVKNEATQGIIADLNGFTAS